MKNYHNWLGVVHLFRNGKWPFLPLIPVTKFVLKIKMIADVGIRNPQNRIKTIENELEIKKYYFNKYFSYKKTSILIRSPMHINNTIHNVIAHDSLIKMCTKSQSLRINKQAYNHNFNLKQFILQSTSKSPTHIYTSLADKTHINNWI